MPTLPPIVASHSDETLLAEIAFWAKSANYSFIKAGHARELCEFPQAAAVILELSEQSEGDLDTLQQVARAATGKVVAITALDAKTISSIRRLLEAKALNVVILARGDFNTKVLADILAAKSVSADMDRDMLERAIRDGHVVAHYQPKVPFQQENKKYGVEALCRIEHPTRGTLYPDSFIPLAEAEDLILDLTDAVTVHAFRSLASWDEAGLKLRLAINISPRLMSDTVWFERFQARCVEYKIDPTRITLEVTESSSQGGKVLALEILSRLRLKGFLLSIDDFGTGFSSLETLYKLPFGELKIDKGFIFDLQKSNEARALIESTIMLARKLGLKICAEGVESEQIFNELRDMQCDDAQGFHISKALPADKVVPFFGEWEERQRRAAAKPASSSKFASIHALLAELLSSDDDGEDSTIVLTSGAPQPAALESAREVAARIPALLLGGDMIAALAHLHRAVRACSDGKEAELRRKLQKIQSELEWVLTTPRILELRSGESTIQLLAGQSFTIGRQSTSSSADIPIACRWMSRGEKNLRVFAQGSGWYIEDLGSTNGHFLDGKRLMSFKAHRLDVGETLIEIGKSEGAAAPAWLLFRVGAEGAVRFSFGAKDANEHDAQGNNCTDWILFDFEFTMGRSPAATIVVPECGAEIEADVSLRNNGIWVAPRSGETIRLNDTEFSQTVPLVPGNVLTIGNSTWSVHIPGGPTAPQSLAISA